MKPLVIEGAKQLNAKVRPWTTVTAGDLGSGLRALFHRPDRSLTGFAFGISVVSGIESKVNGKPGQYLCNTSLIERGFLLPMPRQTRIFVHSILLTRRVNSLE
ncbi:MAG: hypothetical protein ACREXS_08215 [Gammaproteobacteria bacterium]